MINSLSQNITIDKEKCICCSKCIDACILDNLRLKAAPCNKNCPLEVNCQGFINLVAHGNFDKALNLIMEKIPFPQIINRVCIKYCKSSCLLNKEEKPIDVCGIYLNLIKNRELNYELLLPKYEKSKSVCVIGSSLAGIMSSFVLRKEGFNVTLIELGEKLGDELLNYGEDFGITQDIIRQDLLVLNRVGIEIVNYNEMEMSLEELKEAYDAVIITSNSISSNNKLNIDISDFSANEFGQSNLAPNLFITFNDNNLIQNMTSGKEIGESVRRFLMGMDLGSNRKSRLLNEKLISKKVSSNNNIDSSQQEIMDIVNECLSCGNVEGTYRTCWSCLACEEECPEKAIYVEIPFLMR